MQMELDELLVNYEKLIGDKLSLFHVMLGNLREISKNNESVICAEEEIARLRTNMDFIKREGTQKINLLDE
jgi:hypothetical protein